MESTILRDIANLGPALGAVVAVGIVCYFLVQLLKKVLDMFDKHGEALSIVAKNMQAHTDVLKEVERNVQQNTEVTQHMTKLLKTHLNQTNL